MTQRPNDRYPIDQTFRDVVANDLRDAAERWAAEDGLGAVELIARARLSLDDVLPELVPLVKDAGATYAQLGAALGVSRQAVHEKYGRLLTGDAETAKADNL